MKIDDILSKVDHRPWEIPNSPWKYYQEWNDALFLHWEVPFEILADMIPSQLELDNFNSKYYVSIVAFKMEKIRPRYFPSLSVISDFYEINVRTYVKAQNKTGVYFLNMEAGKSLSAFLCRVISGLPYEKAEINRTQKSYSSTNKSKDLKLDVEFSILKNSYEKSKLDQWLTERYSLYAEKAGRIFRYEIHHHEWGVQNIELQNINVDYKIGKLKLNENTLESYHYSKGVHVVAWEREFL